MKPVLLALILSVVPTLAFAGHWKERIPKGKQITLTVHSSPEGAILFANDARTRMGPTPVELVYQMDGSDKCQLRQGMAVYWASGAKAEIQGISLCPSVGSNQQYMFIRPNTPGSLQDRNVDVQQELMLTQTALQRQQIEFEQEQLAVLKRMQLDQAIANAFQAFQTGFQNGFYNTYLRRPISCHTSRIGRQWFTSCY